MADFHYLWTLPIITAAMALLAMLVPYTIGASLAHFPALVPYISDGGAYAPEGHFFSMFMTLAGVLLAVTVFVRHCVLVSHFRERQVSSWRSGLSIAALIIAWIQCLGMFVVGSFDEMSTLRVHNYSALVLFISGIVYTWLTVLLSLLSLPLCGVPCAVLRIVIAVVMTAFLVIHEMAINFNTFVTDPTADPGKNDGDSSGYVIEWLTPDSPFYINKMVSTSSEWVTAIAIFSFLFTFIAEFRRVVIILPLIRFSGAGYNPYAVYPDYGGGPAKEGAYSMQAKYIDRAA